MQLRVTNMYSIWLYHTSETLQWNSNYHKSSEARANENDKLNHNRHDIDSNSQVSQFISGNKKVHVHIRLQQKFKCSQWNVSQIQKRKQTKLLNL